MEDVTASLTGFFNVILWIFGIAIIGLIIVGILYVWFLIFKWLCTIHAEIVADKIRDVMEDFQEGKPELDE